MDGGAVSAGPCSRPQAQQDLNITAEALYNRMGDASFASDDIYWASLPTHLRQFIRNALPLAGNLPQSGSQPGILPGGVQSAGGQVAMYRMAQEIIGAATRTFDDKRSAKEFGMSTETGVIESTRRDDLSQRGDKPSGKQNISTSPPADIPLKHLDEASEQITLRTNPVAPSPRTSQMTSQKHAEHPLHRSQLDTAQRSRPTTQSSTAGVSQKSPSAIAHPAPSSRAAGKQPMQSHPMTAGGVEPSVSSTGTPNNRSARSAGKAPVPHPSTASVPPPLAGDNGAPTNKAALASTGKTKALPAATPSTRDWRITTVDERVRVQEYWTRLEGATRTKFIQAERDGVLRRIKDYQRHTCSCGICGRKRIAIEREIGSLYSFYGQALDRSPRYTSDNGREEHPDIRRSAAGPFPGSVEVDRQGNILRADYLAPEPKSLIEEEIDDESFHSDDYEDEDEDEDEDGDYDEEEDEFRNEHDLGASETDRTGDGVDAGYNKQHVHKQSRHLHRESRDNIQRGEATAEGEIGTNVDFSSFHGPLANLKGVLSVADDLLKGEGQGFLEMMEQLVERRVLGGLRSRSPNKGNHGHDAVEDPTSEPVIDEETPELHDDSGRDDFDLSLQHRRAEGERLFQVFAARLLEQRVLQAYREQVAQEKQLQFLRELEEEETAAEAREARKAKEAQKKKDKRRQQKQAKDDEKAKRDALLAEEAEMARVKQATAEKEANRRREDERVRREAEKRAKLEDQLRKEEERRKRQEREKEAEKAKKQRERDERSKSNRSIAGEVVPMNGENQRLSNNGGLATSRKQSTPQALPVPTSDTGRLLERGRSSKPANEDIPQPKSDASYRPSSRPSAGEAQHENSATASASQTRHAADEESRYMAEDVASSGIANTRLAVTTRPNELAVDTSPAVYDTQQWDAPLAAKAVASPTQEGSTIATIPSTATVTPSMPIEGSVLSGVVGSAVSSTAYPLGATGTNARGGAYVAGVTSHGQMAENAYPVMISPGIPAPIRQGVHHSGTMLAAPGDALPVTRLQDPIGPIQPIGRPRPCGPPFPLEQLADHVGKPFSTRTASVSHDQVLGSAALSSGDDEVIIPAPRRVSHGHNALGSKWNAGSQLSSPHWGAAFAAAPAPIWGRSELSPGAVHTWPAAGNSGTYIGHRYDGPLGLAESFSARGHQQQQGTSRTVPAHLVDIAHPGHRAER